jgi:undecaprenyl-phosphate 4-deoxy-4-formamido-L-arabinose transferase
MARRLSIVVPVYNGEGTLAELVDRLNAVLDSEAAEYEIVLVNDGSTDDSWNVVKRLASGGRHVRGLDLMRNFGQHNALLAGVRAARNPVIVTLDDDLQNPPEEIPKLLAKLDEGYDVVYGSGVRPHGLWRNLSTAIVKRALRGIIGSDVAAQVGPFRAFRTEVREAFRDFHAPFVSLDVLLSWGTTRYASVQVEHQPRPSGRSSYGFIRLATYTLNVVTGFSTRPLRFASLVGVAFTLVGIAVLVLVLVRYFAEGDSVPGFPFLASLIAIFSGAQLLTLGIIGEYISRMHVRVMDRPAYALREEVGDGD